MKLPPPAIELMMLAKKAAENSKELSTMVKSVVRSLNSHQGGFVRCIWLFNVDSTEALDNSLQQA